MFRKFLYLIALLSIFNTINAQNKSVYIGKTNENIHDFIRKTESQNNIKFYFFEDSIPDIQIIVKSDSILLENLLEESLQDYHIKVSSDELGNIFLFKNFSLKRNINLSYKHKPESYDSIKNSSTYDSNIKTYSSLINEKISIKSKNQTNLPEKVIFSGYVYNLTNNTPVYPVLLRINETDYEITNNSSGYFKIELKPGNYTLSVNSLGMYGKDFNLEIEKNGTYNILLETKPIAIDEVTISATQNENVKSTNMGFEKISVESIKNLPMVLGEKDVIKFALLLPGVQSVSEMSEGFNVRGSPTDQNIFYINNLPVYNSAHVFGLFTAFNGDAIEEFKFYKNNIPIEYGGQLSSIFEISTKKGRVNNFSLKGGIGPTSARLSAEGPIIKDKISYLLSVRSTYSDWVLNIVNNPEIKNSSLSFYDALANFTFNLNDKNTIDVFTYISNDIADLSFGIKNNYSNKGASINYNHVFNTKLKSELTLLHSNFYTYEENSEIKSYAYKNSFDINHSELKIKFKLAFNPKNKLNFGINSKYYELIPGDFLPLNDSSLINSQKFEKEQASNNSLFLGYYTEINKNISFEAGVRANNYMYLGPKTVFLYDLSKPRNEINIIDSTIYDKNNIIKNNYDFDYRLSLNYKINKDNSIKASYNILHQYIFKLSENVTSSSVGVWKLSDSHLKPMKGEQYSIGIYKNYLNLFLESSFEIYYKNTSNLVEYKDGASFKANKYPEANVIQGELKAYGFEFMIKKKGGNLNGWINYTYSKSLVSAIDKMTGEMNNYGIEYSANYDRPHAANLTLNYNFTKRISISSNVVYSSGRPVTYPTSIYYLNEIQVTAYSKRNEYRIPDYFRIDLAFNFEGNLKRNKIAHSSWSLGFYNLTSRKNPYTITFRNVDGKIHGYKISILGGIIPSITFNLKLGNYEN